MSIQPKYIDECPEWLLGFRAESQGIYYTITLRSDENPNEIRQVTVFFRTGQVQDVHVERINHIIALKLMYTIWKKTDAPTHRNLFQKGSTIAVAQKNETTRQIASLSTTAGGTLHHFIGNENRLTMVNTPNVDDEYKLNLSARKKYKVSNQNHGVGDFSRLERYNAIATYFENPPSPDQNSSSFSDRIEEDMREAPKIPAQLPNNSQPPTQQLSHQIRPASNNSLTDSINSVGVNTHPNQNHNNLSNSTSSNQNVFSHSNNDEHSLSNSLTHSTTTIPNNIGFSQNSFLSGDIVDDLPIIGNDSGSFNPTVNEVPTSPNKATRHKKRMRFLHPSDPSKRREFNDLFASSKKGTPLDQVY